MFNVNMYSRILNQYIISKQRKIIIRLMFVHLKTNLFRLLCILTYNYFVIILSYNTVGIFFFFFFNIGNKLTIP